jgi:hypothetical protein
MGLDLNKFRLKFWLLTPVGGMALANAVGGTPLANASGRYSVS